MQRKVETQIAGRTFSIEVGRVAKQAGGSALVQCGDTVVLVTATAAQQANMNVDFLPLTVDYQERTFAAGKPARTRRVADTPPSPRIRTRSEGPCSLRRPRCRPRSSAIESSGSLGKGPSAR